MQLSQEILDEKRAELARESMQATSATTSATSISIGAVVGDFVVVAYKGIPGNQPNTYGNYLAIWQGSDIPWNTAPLATQTIVSNTPDGSVTFPVAIGTNSYIVGYAVSPQLTAPKQLDGNVCASAVIPPSGGQTPPPFTPSLMVTYVSSDAVAVQFSLPAGCLPQTNGAWIGLWESGQPSYITTPKPPDGGRNNIQIDAPSGGAFINGLTLKRGKTYTVGLFMSGWSTTAAPAQKALACSVTFQL